MEDKIDSLSTAVLTMQSLLVKQGFLGRDVSEDEKGEVNSPKMKSKRKDGSKKDKPKKTNVEKTRKGEKVANLNNSVSESTIYRNAVEFIPEAQQNDCEIQSTGDPEITFKKRGRSSSEDQLVDTSDELTEVDVDHFNADCEATARNEFSRNEPPRRELDPAADYIHQVEASKAALFGVKGMDNNMNVNVNGQMGIDNQGNMIGKQFVQMQQAAVVDDNYMMVGAHVDEGIQKRIINNEYIDFARLLAKDRIAWEEDGCMEIVHRGGSTYFVPVSDRETASGIHNFSKWEQAF